VLGIVNLVYKFNTGHSIFGEIHFLLTVPFYFVWSILVMVVVSLVTPKPSVSKIENLTFSYKEFKEEGMLLKQGPVLKSYRFWSYVLVAFCLIILVLFW
jgi:SSS family solute:Na+ symporter